MQSPTSFPTDPTNEFEYFVFLSGSASQMIKVYSLGGANLSTIRYHDGFMGQRIGPISCLAFHPHRVRIN